MRAKPRPNPIEDASRVTAGPPSFDDCSRTVKISASWKCYGTAPAHMLGKIWVEIFLTLAALQIYQKNGRAHFEDNVSKNVSKSHARNRKKTKKKMGLEGVLGGLGAFLEPCRAGLAAEAQKCTPEVAKLPQLGGILEVKLEPKSQKKSLKKRLNF